MGAKNTIQSAYSAVRSAYKDTSLKKLYPSRYLAAAKGPVRPGYVVFLEVREKELTDNFRLIRAALERRNRESGENEGKAEEKAEEKVEGTQGPYSFDTVCIREGMENPASVTLRCLAAIPKIARAEYVFVNESSYFLSSLPLRPETTVIQTWHACGAFKKFGYSAVGKGFGTTEADLEKYPVHKNFSYVT
ncbi:MAG: CDP-glycerol glycerophosphotransferase family protein, partial [Eubacterium sp.]